MSNSLLMVIASVFLLVHFVALYKLGRHQGGVQWIISAGALYGSGLFGALAVDMPLLAALPPAFSTLYAALLYLGTAKFLGHKTPDWFMSALLLTTLMRGVIAPFIPPAFNLIPGAIIIIASAAASSWILFKYQKTSLWSYLFIVGTLGISVSSILFVRAGLTGEGVPLSLTVWTMTSIFLGGSQVLLLLNKVAESFQEVASVLGSLVDSIPSGIMLTNSSGSITAANDYLERLIGLNKKQSLIGKQISFVVPLLRARLKDEPDENQNIALSAMTDNKGMKGVKYRLKDDRTILMSSSNVRTDANENVGFLWFFNDVSEAWRLGREQDEVRRLEMLVSLTGGIAHEFNNKLTAVKGGVFAANSKNSDQAVAESLTMISEAADKCLNLTTNLLTVSSELPRELTTINLADWLPEIMARLTQDLPDTITVDYAAPSDVGTFVADQNQLQKLLTILLDNSRNAIKQSGKIEVKANRVNSSSGNWIEISIKDDGVGIAEDVLPRIFDPFYTSQEFGAASGLGLPMAKGIMQAHEGDVYIKSQPGKGTLVTTCWPAGP